MKTFDIQIMYRTADGQLEDPWLVIASRSKSEAKKLAQIQANQKAANGKGSVRQIRLAT